jgi:hypothetical protein
MQTPRELVEGPPKGFRKTIPTLVKLDVVIRQEGKCKACGEKLGTLKDTQFDHVPAIQLRAWDEEAGDTSPPSNCPEHIEAKHNDCHLAKTTGRKGSSKLSVAGGDVQEIAKLKRLEERRAEEFRNALLSNTDEDPPPEDKPKRKHRWPKRPLRSGGWNGSKHKRAEEGS